MVKTRKCSTQDSVVKTRKMFYATARSISTTEKEEFHMYYGNVRMAF